MIDFNHSFFCKVGLLFVILGAVLYIIAFFRARHSAHDFADRHKEAQILDSGIKTEGQDNTRIFGRPFVTAGWTVVQVTVAVAAVELGLLGLIIRQVSRFFFHSCAMDFSHLSCHRHSILDNLCKCIAYDHLYQYSFSKFNIKPPKMIQCKKK